MCGETKKLTLNNFEITVILLRHKKCKWKFGILELRNRFTQNDVTVRVTNSKLLTRSCKIKNSTSSC